MRLDKVNRIDKIKFHIKNQPRSETQFITGKTLCGFYILRFSYKIRKFIRNCLEK